MSVPALLRLASHEHPVFRGRRAGRAASARPVGGYSHCRGIAAPPSRTRRADRRRCSSAAPWKPPSAPPTPSGAWDWKAAYEACEVATVLFLRKYGKALFRKSASPAARLSVLTKIVGLLPTHTRRSEESQALQQFSTPLPLGLAALTAAAITPTDRVLEPSAGTGLLAILAATAGGSLILNELAETRADLLTSLFPAIPVTRFDAAQIDDHLDASAVPTVVLMNPPFSAMAHVAGRVADAGFRHIASALNRLAPGGRLVTITGANVGPDMAGLARRLSSACRSAAASCSPPPSLARSMPGTVRPSRRG